MTQKTLQKHARGVVLIIALLVLAVLSLLAINGLMMSRLEVSMTQHFRGSAIALATAEAALSTAAAQLLDGNLQNGSVTVGDATGRYQIRGLAEAFCSLDYEVTAWANVQGAVRRLIAEYRVGRLVPNCPVMSLRRIHWQIVENLY